MSGGNRGDGDEFQHAPVQRAPASLARDVARHPGVEAVPAEALHVLHAVAADDAEVAEDDRFVLVPLLFAEIPKLDAQHGGERHGEWVIARAIFGELQLTRDVFDGGEDFLADGRLEDALVGFCRERIDGAIKHGSGFAVHLGDEQAAVAGAIRIVLLQVAGIPFRAEAEVECATYFEKETRVGGGVIKELGVAGAEGAVDAIRGEPQRGASAVVDLRPAHGAVAGHSSSFPSMTGDAPPSVTSRVLRACFCGTSLTVLGRPASIAGVTVTVPQS